jgi:hypothetical protein
LLTALFKGPDRRRGGRQRAASRHDLHGSTTSVVRINGPVSLHAQVARATTRLGRQEPLSAQPFSAVMRPSATARCSAA